MYSPITTFRPSRLVTGYSFYHGGWLWLVEFRLIVPLSNFLRSDSKWFTYRSPVVLSALLEFRSHYPYWCYKCEVLWRYSFIRSMMTAVHLFTNRSLWGPVKMRASLSLLHNWPFRLKKISSKNSKRRHLEPKWHNIGQTIRRLQWGRSWVRLWPDQHSG